MKWNTVKSFYVQFGEIGGGTDQESDDDLRDRIIDRYQR